LFLFFRCGSISWCKGSCSLGAAQKSIEAVIAHSKVRKQFGQPLANFQVLLKKKFIYLFIYCFCGQNTQFKLAELATDLTASRLMVRNAAGMMDSKHAQATAYCAMAKLFATDRCFDVIMFFFIYLFIHSSG